MHDRARCGSRPEWVGAGSRTGTRKAELHGWQAARVPDSFRGMKSAEAVREVVFRLEAGGRPVAVWTSSPGGYRELAVGRLVAAGYLDPGAAVVEVEVEETAAGAVARVAVPAWWLERGESESAHRRAAGCGLLHYVDCAPELIAGRERRPLPEADWAALFQSLYGPGESRSSGLHAAALSDGVSLRHRVEEVGRHNAVDRVVGASLLAGEAPGDMGLVVSSRVSGEIALKAARAGLAWIATRSVPTTLALEIAATAALPIVARAVGARPRVYDGDEARGEAV